MAAITGFFDSSMRRTMVCELAHSAGVLNAPDAGAAAKQLARR
jgi:hypothetical protein